MCVWKTVPVKQEELVCVSCHQSTLLYCRIQCVFVLVKRVTHTCLSVFFCSLRLSPMAVSNNQCFDIKTSNHIWTSCSNVCFLSYFCSTQMFFYHSFILYFYFYCTPCGSNYFYIPWIYITFTFLCSFPILFHFHSSLISDILYQPRCCFLCCVFNVNVVYICRSEMGRALPDLRKKQTPFWLSFICLISW